MVPRPYPLRLSTWALAVLAVGLGASGGCSSDSASTPGVTHPTMIEVAPEEFLGSLGCSTESSAQRYVATLFDETDLNFGGADGEERQVDKDGVPLCGGFQLPSSEPTSCLTSVGFGYVVHGRRYCVEVDAYGTDQIEPRGAGTRKMVVGDPDDAELSQQAPLAERSFHTFCEGATAYAATIVRARGCLPLFPQPMETDPAAVQIRTDALLGSLTCDDIVHVDVELGYEGLEFGIHRTPNCGSSVVFEDLPGGIEVSASVLAYEGQEDPFAAATCRAITVPGTTVIADCAELSQKGTLRVDLESALELYGLSCDHAVDDVRVQFVDAEGETQERHFPPPDCLEPFDSAFLPRPDEEEEIRVTISHAGADACAVCHGAVALGRVVVAQCDLAECVPLPTP